MAPAPTATPPVAAALRRPAAAAGRALLNLIADSPAFPILLICVAVLVWFAGDEGGLRGTTFLPAALILLALLAVALAVLPRPQPSRRTLAAVALLAGYALWSYLSVLWAEQQGIAWDGANRTVLYALLFALFALYPLRGGAAAALLGAYGLGIAGIALVELLKADAASQAIQYFHEGRLGEPVGYVNANVALWFTAFWPCLVLAGRRQVPAALRGLFLAAATLLAGIAVLGESRGWLFAVPVTIVLALVLVPGRGRTIVSLGVVGVGVLLVLGPLIDVYDAFKPFKPTGEALSEAVRLLLVVSVGTGLIGAGAAVYETTVHLHAPHARRISAGLVALVAAAAVAAVGVYGIAKGNPVTAAADKWNEFKTGGVEPHFGKSRFSTAVSTYRYDYWRVAWKEFEREPLIGIGADNFQYDYLKSGKSYQTPKYPHSTQLRALAQTGLVGGLLFFGAVGAALAVALPRIRRAGLTGVVAGTGLLMFAYWFIHGSLEMLWEFPAVGGPAIAGLGLAAAHSRRDPDRPREPFLAGWRRVAPAAGVGVLVAAGLAVPWFAERDLRAARELAGRDPAGALERLDRSARLNPLASLPSSTAGVIRVRQGDLIGAQAEFRRALERDPQDSFSTLMLAGIASKQGHPSLALRLAERAHQLAPRDDVTGSQLRRLRRGRGIDPGRLEGAFQRNVHDRVSGD